MSTRRRVLLVLAVALFGLAVAGFAVLNSDSEPEPSFSEEAAIGVALADKDVRKITEQEGYSDVRVTAIDNDLTRVTFSNGRRIVVEAALGEDGSVVARADYLTGFRYGAELANRAPVLILLTGIFLLATLTLPLRSARNLDVLALAAFVIPVALLNERYLDRSVVTAYLLLAYLGWRCIQRGVLGRPPEPAGTPLLAALTAGPDAARRSREVGLITGGLAVLVALITLTSTNVIDVGFASMNGATLISDGTPPYGRITEVLHGDTYPFLAYLFYLPVAWVAPVHDIFDSTDGALVVAMLAVLAGALAFARKENTSAALAWLAFPPVLLTASSGSNDILFAALVAWALVLWRHAGRSTAAWVAAAWVKVVPVAVLPLWLARLRGREEATRAWTGLALVSLACLVWLVALDGPGAVADMVSAISYQFERRSLYSAWTLLDVEAARAVFQGALVALAIVSAGLAWRAKLDLPRLAALSGALLIAAQLAGNYWAVTYMAWTFPCVYFALLSGSAAASPRAADPAR